MNDEQHLVTRVGGHPDDVERRRPDPHDHGRRLDAGIWHGQGRYRAVCGAEVIAAALVSGPGPGCPECPGPSHAPSHPPGNRPLRAALAALTEFRARRGPGTATSRPDTRHTTGRPMTMTITEHEASARFPLGAGNFSVLASAEPPSTSGVRPFVLRFGRTRRAPAPGTLAQARYDHGLQVAVDPSGVPLSGGSGTGTMATTGPSPDGKGSTGNEEWTPDYAGDMSGRA